MITTNKLLVRKIMKQLPIFFAAVFIVSLSIAFFVAVKTVYIEFDDTGKKYFSQNMLNDTLLFGMFNEDDESAVSKIEGVDFSEKRHRFEASVVDINTDAIVYGRANNSPNINKPYIHEGSEELKANELRINKNYADYHNLKLGDEVSLEINNETNSFKISSLVSYPNYIFLFKDRSTTVSDTKDLAIIEINEEYFNDKYIPYNTLYVKYKDDNIDNDKTEMAIKKELGEKIFLLSTKDQSANYAYYKQTLSQIDTFSYIMPIILLTMAGLLLYVIQRRNVAVERKQIGIMKALGLDNFKILFMYIQYSFIIAFLGIFFAFVITESLLPFIFRSLKSLFDLPNFFHSRYIYLWLISSSLIFIVCSLANLIAASSILKMNPAQSMRGETPKSGNKLFFENTAWWKKRSFNTRYAVKTAFRGKTRYFASLWGMFTAVSITIFAQGFNNSFEYFLDSLYSDFANYDVDALISDTNISDTPNYITENSDIIKHYDKASIYQARISHPYKTGSDYRIDNPALIYENGFSALDIPYNKDYKDGVMLSSSIARRLEIKEGDLILVELYIPGDTKYKRVEVTKLVDQPGMFFLYIEREYAEEVFEISNTYNFLYLSGNASEIENILYGNNDVLSYSIKSQQEESSRKQIATIRILIQILIIVAFLLGAASLYGIGIVTLATRRYEFTLLKVMGYSTREIILASIKETVSQIIIATPLAILVGYFSLHLIKSSFSSEFFDFIPNVYLGSYFMAVGLLLLAITFVTLMSAKYINAIDMVEGLKERED